MPVLTYAGNQPASPFATRVFTEFARDFDLVQGNYPDVKKGSERRVLVPLDGAVLRNFKSNPNGKFNQNEIVERVFGEASGFVGSKQADTMGAVAQYHCVLVERDAPVKMRKLTWQERVAPDHTRKWTLRWIESASFGAHFDTMEQKIAGSGLTRVIKSVKLDGSDNGYASPVRLTIEFCGNPFFAGALRLMDAGDPVDSVDRVKVLAILLAQHFRDELIQGVDIGFRSSTLNFDFPYPFPDVLDNTLENKAPLLPAEWSLIVFSRGKGSVWGTILHSETDKRTLINLEDLGGQEHWSLHQPEKGLYRPFQAPLIQKLASFAG